MCEKCDSKRENFPREWVKFLRKNKKFLSPIERDLYGITALEKLKRSK